MKKNDFVGYVGDADLHDAHIRSVSHTGDHVEVMLESHNGRELKVSFSGVKKVIVNQPEGMMIYALTEMRAESPHRRFLFTNWDETDKASLEIEAREFKVECE